MLNWHKKFACIGAPLLSIYIAVLYAYAAKAVDIYPVRYEASLDQGIDFSKDGYPFFVDKVSGLSVRESWGRWTNQYRGNVIVAFKSPLPRKFTLIIDAIAFNVNGNSPTIIRVGDQNKQVLISSEKYASYSVEFSNVSDGVGAIEITPSNPMSPAQLDATNKDGRLIGIGLRSLRIISNEN